MAYTNTSSTPQRLAELNTQILGLEKERAAILRQELASAEARVESVSAFIGASSRSRGPSAAAPRAEAAPAKKKRRGPKTRKWSRRGTASKKAARGTASGGDRTERVLDVIAAAGNDGISARQLSETTGIPYSAIRKIVSETSQIQQRGEKRASRLILR